MFNYKKTLEMYRLLVLLCLNSLVVGQWGLAVREGSSLGDGGGNMYWRGGHGARDNSPTRSPCGISDRDEHSWPLVSDSHRISYYNRVEIAISEIARKLIAAGQKMEQFCIAHSDRALREVYGVEHFKLRVRLSEFTEDNIEVRVRQRLVSIYARSCSDEYAALRILPDVVDAHRAVWRFERGTLTVLFPYNISPDTLLDSRCGRQVNEGVIIVPQSPAGTVFDRDYDLSFGDVNLKSAIRQYLQSMLHEGTLSDNSQEFDSLND